MRSKARRHGLRGRRMRRAEGLRATLIITANESLPKGFNAYVAGVRPYQLDELRAMGEPGILFLGLTAGYTLAEIAADRKWTADDCARHLAALKAYGEERRRHREL